MHSKPIRILYIALLAASVQCFAADAVAEAPNEASAEAVSPIPDDKTLERLGAVVGQVEIVRLDVFDPSNPEEDKALYRLANRAHVETSEGLIRNQLLFGPGDPYNRRVLEETERSLRTNRYIYDAKISVARFDAGVVDLTVVTQDVWTLSVSGSGSRSGGQNTASIKLKELNLFGSGIGIELGHSRNVDRDSTTFRIVDDHIAGSRFGGFGSYASSTDGYTRELGFGQPFYSLDTHHAGGISAYDGERTDQIYDLGEVVDEYQHVQRSGEVFFGRSAGLKDNWLTRYIGGFAFEEHRFDPLSATTGAAGFPNDRRFAYPFVGIEVLEDDFEETSNLQQIQRPEDVFMGTKFAARLGYSSSAWGGEASAWLGEASISNGIGSVDGTSLRLRGSAEGRLKGGNLIGVVGGGATLNWRQSEWGALQIRLDADFGHLLDADQHLLLGGDTGLRGYPLRYQRGEKRALFSVEQRFFTDWQPFQLFNVGAVAFFDAGRMWTGGLPGTTDADLLSDVGIGLRLGNRRSGAARMIHIDLAVPLNGGSTLDKFQLLIGSAKSF